MDTSTYEPLSAGDVAAQAADALVDYVYDEDGADVGVVTDTPYGSVFILSLASGQRFRVTVAEEL